MDKQRKLTWYGQWRNILGPLLYQFEDDFVSEGEKRIYKVLIRQTYRKEYPDPPVVFQRAYTTSIASSIEDARDLHAEQVLADVVWQDTRLFPFVEGCYTRLETFPENRDFRLTWPVLYQVKFGSQSGHPAKYKTIHLPDPNLRQIHAFLLPRIMVVNDHVLFPDVSPFSHLDLEGTLHWCLAGMGTFHLKRERRKATLDFHMRLLGEEKQETLREEESRIAFQAMMSFAKFAASVFPTFAAFNLPPIVKEP